MAKEVDIFQQNFNVWRCKAKDIEIQEWLYFKGIL